MEDKSKLSSTENHFLFIFFCTIKQHRCVLILTKINHSLLPRFSTDEGQCWKSYNFTEQPFYFAGLLSEPGTKAMNVSVWGFRPEEDGQPMWVAVTIDFQSLITRQCKSRH